MKSKDDNNYCYFPHSTIPHTQKNHKCMPTDGQCGGEIIRLAKISSMLLEVSYK
jgi:hypothetical protein